MELNFFSYMLDYHQLLQGSLQLYHYVFSMRFTDNDENPSTKKLLVSNTALVEFCIIQICSED